MKTNILLFILVFFYATLQASEHNQKLITRLNQEAVFFKQLRSSTKRKPAVIDVKILPHEIEDLESEFESTQKQASLTRTLRKDSPKKTRLRY